MYRRIARADFVAITKTFTAPRVLQGGVPLLLLVHQTLRMTSSFARTHVSSVRIGPVHFPVEAKLLPNILLGLPETAKVLAQRAAIKGGNGERNRLRLVCGKVLGLLLILFATEREEI